MIQWRQIKDEVRSPEFAGKARIAAVSFAAGVLLTGVVWVGSDRETEALKVGASLGDVGAVPFSEPPSAPSAAPAAPATQDPLAEPVESPRWQSEPHEEPAATYTPSVLPEDTECPAEPTVVVGTAGELQSALDAAVPGDVIGMRPGRYVGEFSTEASGTSDRPITLCGTADSILDGDNPRGGYVFHLDGAKYWRVHGFTVTNGQKGVMADGTVGTTISGLSVHSIGDEGIHLRRFSTDNVVENNVISNTGLRREKFGEGIYIGTAQSNWCIISECRPDNSDRNIVRNNTIFGTTAEAVDIKEGTSDGLLQGNTFDGSRISDADSWVDVKGRGWVIDGNTGTNSPLDGFQTHEIVDEWGTRNVFRNNTANVNGPGYGYSLTPVRDNKVECSNKATGAGEGLSNVECSG